MPGLAVDAERRVPFVKLFWGDAEHVPDVFAGSGFIAIVPPVDAALDGFGVEGVDWLPGSSTKMSKDQRYQDAARAVGRSRDWPHGDDFFHSCSSLYPSLVELRRVRREESRAIRERAKDVGIPAQGQAAMWMRAKSLG